MKYKLKKKSNGALFLKIVEFIIYFITIYCVVNYLGSVALNNPSEIYHFIFVAVLVLFIILKISDYWAISMNELIKLFERK